MLRRWYLLHDGAISSQLFTGVLPGYAELLSLEGSARTTRDYHEIFADLADENEEFAADTAGADDDLAGEMAFRFLFAWVPIAEDGDACTMIVDCRGGDQYGCVTLCERENSDTSGPVWASVDAMLAELADALEQDRSCGGWHPRLNGGVLEWEPGND